jgi:predicted ATP-dependent endonuclease of OLD family
VLGKKDEAFDDLSGKGLIDHLATLQNPDWDRQDDRKKFQRINHFLQDVTGKPEATLEVPNGKEHLLVHMDNKVLPLSSLGTGIHEVVLIAAFCTIHDNSIMCIEEPEIHLHPLLQKKLINYLIENTSSQYFVATHSAAFIDTAGANIFRVTNDGEQTFIKAVLTKNGQREILDDLGYQASHILQANAVIWVEGPSDRTYLNHWLNAADSELSEGIHYTIMFYGGSLIRHLSASDDALCEFIKLRDLNRNMAIIIDSDRDSASASLKPHTQRLLDEMSDDGGLVWITAGREMENYVDGSELQKVIKELHPRIFVAEGKTGQYDHAFYFFRANTEKEGHKVTCKDADKVGIANKICQMDARLDILDLRERIIALTDMIRKANGLPSRL